MVYSEQQILLTNKIKNKAYELGFDPVGIAIIPGSENINVRTKDLEQWLSKGNHASMGWMEAPRRKNIETILTGAKSVIAVGFNYYVNKNRTRGALKIARYAWGGDYHKLIEKKLKIIGGLLSKYSPKTKWTICVDSKPLLEKAWAEEAGLGWVGKNSNIISKTKGSWIVLGFLISTEQLKPDKPIKNECSDCDICIKACPTNAIEKPYVINSNLCLAYHTIENRSKTLPENISKSQNRWIAGCDICQDVCPWNTKK